MRFVEAGRHTLNVEYLIRHERGDGVSLPKDVIRIVMALGESIELSGADAEAYLEQMAEIAPNVGAVAGVIQPTRVLTQRPEAPASGDKLPP